MNTETLTIGVPMDVYAKLSRKEIKERLITNLSTVDQFYFYPGKRVNIGIRLDAETAETIRVNAAFNDIAITEYTASLLYEGAKPCLSNNP